MCTKVYIVVRHDMEPGLQAAQACHALREFVAAHPDLDATWHANSKTLVLLSVPGEADLERLASKAKEKDVPVALNYEPDLGGSLTAIALATGAKKLVSSLPLLLKAG